MSAVELNTRLAIAWRAAQDLPDCAYINLGVGIPSEAARFVPKDREVLFHSENGILGVGPRAEGSSINRNLVNASQQFVTIERGASYFDCCESFAMVRGGHIDIALLGAYEVAANGDLANWDRGNHQVPPAVGGAMDIAVGTHQIWVLMEHRSSKGQPRLVERTTLPLTGAGIVNRVYTDLAVIDITPEGGMVLEMLADLSFSQLQEYTEWKLFLSNDWRPMRMPNFAAVRENA